MNKGKTVVEVAAEGLGQLARDDDAVSRAEASAEADFGWSSTQPRASGPSRELRDLNLRVTKIREAHNVVGNTGARRLAWLLDTVQLTADEFKARREALRYQFAAFVYSASPTPKLPSRAMISAIAAQIIEGVKVLRSAGRWETVLPGTAISRSLEKGYVKVRGRWISRFESHIRGRGFRAEFLILAGDAIETEGARIRECARPDCKRLFVRTRRGIYCSARCSQAVRDRRFQQKHSAEDLKTRLRVSQQRQRKKKKWLKGRAAKDAISK